MAIFSKIRTLGQKIFGRNPEAARLRQQAEVEQARKQRADREIADAQRLQRELSTRGRSVASTRAAEQEAERIRAKVSEQARRERLAREESARAKARAEELRRKADEAERNAASREAKTSKAREAYLRTRRNLRPEEWDTTFQGPRPVAPKIDKNRKEAGEGLLPELQAFLYLRVPLSRFASSNVQSIVYDNLSKALHVQYIKSQKWYRYSGVPIGIARLAYSAASRGVFVWDELRVRGTRSGNKFTTTKNSPPPEPIDPTSTAGQIAIGGVGM